MPARLKLTEEMADALAESVRMGVPVETAVQAAGVSRGQFYEWLQVAQRGTWQEGSPVSESTQQTILDFADKIRRAQAEWEANHVRAIAEDAEAYNAKTGLRDWRARAFLLTNHPYTRKRWGQHVEVEQHATVIHEHQLVKDLPSADLHQALQALDAPQG